MVTLAATQAVTLVATLVATLAAAVLVGMATPVATQVDMATMEAALLVEREGAIQGAMGGAVRVAQVDVGAVEALAITTVQNLQETILSCFLCCVQ